MFAKPKKRSNDGHTTHVVDPRPKLPKALENAYLADRAKEAEERHQKRLEKEAPTHKGGPQRTLPDAVVLAIRALRDYRGWSARHLAAFFQIPDWKAHQICNYTTMADLIPGEEHVPADAVKPVLKDGRGRRKTKPVPIEAKMAGTYRSLEAVRARKALAADPAEVRMGEGG